MNTGDERFEVDIPRLISVLWRRIWAIILAGILGAGLAFSVATLFVTPQYRSDILLYIDSSQPSVGESLVETYVGILESRSTLDTVISKGGLMYNYKGLYKMLHTESVEGTALFQVGVTAADPEEARKIADLIAEVLPEQAALLVKGSSLSVVDYGSEALEPISPDVPVWTCIGLLLGMAAACGLILCRELFGDVIYRGEYLEKAFELPVLGAVPVLEDEDVIDFTGTEAFGMLRANLLRSFTEEEGKVIGIASSQPEEGEIISAIGLAESLAKGGKRVLLLEGDLRRPRFQRLLKLKDFGGLSHWLMGEMEAEAEPHLFKKNLFVLPAGEICENPAELLGSATMESALWALRGRFDFILISLPPVNEVSDASAIGKTLDGFLLAVRQEVSTAKQVKLALHQLDLSGTKVLGFLLTDADLAEKDSRYDPAKLGDFSSKSKENTPESTDFQELLGK